MSGAGLPRDARAVLRALVPVTCPPEAAPHADAIVDGLELMLSATPPLIRAAFPLGLYAYDLGALPRYGRLARSLVGERAERYFVSWEHGPTPLHVELARTCNRLLSMACYELPSMTAALGYAPAPWIAEVKRKRLAVYGDDVRKQAEQILAPDPLRPGVVVQRRVKGAA
jgi:hypothetical protein